MLATIRSALILLGAAGLTALPMTPGSSAVLAEVLSGTSTCVTFTGRGPAAKTTWRRAAASVPVPILKPTYLPAGWRLAQIHVTDSGTAYVSLTVVYRHRHRPAIFLSESADPGHGSPPFFREIKLDGVAAWASTKAWTCTPVVTLIFPSTATYGLTGGRSVGTLERIAASLRPVRARSAKGT